ncbi:MAG: PA2778 family cysteine peptidase [Gammaproteobacteria bacterium]|nr:PA2778 family cysteine peptidase [Gammaproteobacteria bacterium]
MLAGCASAPQTRLLLENPPALPATVELTEVPFFPQQEYHCGPAALASIFNYHGTPAQPEEIARRVYVPGLKGSLRSEVVAATRQYDLLPVRMQGSMEALLAELAAGNPVFVLQNLGLDAVPVWHYEVVVGYDFARREMILRSGEYPRALREFALFERTWQRAGHWALVIVPPERVPETAGAADFLQTAIDLEQVGRIDTALRAYRAAAQRWPQNLLAHSGAGNAAYALGDFTSAEAAYRRALQIDAAQADVWNNLAYALAQQGRHEASLAAIERALALEPDNTNLRASLRELSNWP